MTIIPYGKHFIDKTDILAVSEVLLSNQITQGPLVSSFEYKVKKYLGVKYTVALSSCSAGLHLALKALQKKKSRNVVCTSPISFVSTANSIIHNNYKPEFIDINRETLNLSTNELKKKIKNKKNIFAVIPVHIGGLASDSKEIYKMCQKKNIYVIEDAAHSFGGKYEDGSMVGSCKYSDLTVFSFHPVKTITTGEGGIVTTNSKKIYDKLIQLRSHGIEKNPQYWKNTNLAFTNKQPNIWYYDAVDFGFNYRITDFQCALGISQLKKIKLILNYRKKVANVYDKGFSNCKNIYIPQLKKRKYSSNHLYILNIAFKNLSISKNDFMKTLLKKKITTQVHYIPITLHSSYKTIHGNNLTTAYKYYFEAISIPIFYNLKFKDQQKIITEIKKLIIKYSIN